MNSSTQKCLWGQGWKVHGWKFHGWKVHGRKVQGWKVHDWIVHCKKGHGWKVHDWKVHSWKVHGGKLWGWKVWAWNVHGWKVHAQVVKGHSNHEFFNPRKLMGLKSSWLKSPGLKIGVEPWGWKIRVEKSGLKCQATFPGWQRGADIQFMKNIVQSFSG